MKFSVLDKKNDFSSRDSTKYVIQVDKTFKSFFANEVTIKPQYKALLDQGKGDDFIRACGTHFIGAQSRVGHASLILQADFLVRNSARLFKSHFFNEVKTSIDVINSSSKVTANLNFTRKLIEKSGDVRVDFIGRGGSDDGISLLSNSTKAADFKKLIKEFEKYSHSISGKKAAVGKSYLIDYSTLDQRIESYPKSEQQLKFLKKASYLRMDANDYISRLEKSIGLIKDNPVNTVDVVSGFRKVIKELRSYDNLIRSLAMKCLKDETTCNSKTPDTSSWDNLKLLGDVFTKVRTEPVCQYQANNILSSIQLGLFGESNLIERVRDIDVSWVSLDGTSGEVNLPQGHNLETNKEDGRFILDLDVVRVSDSNGQVTLSAATQALRNAKDRFYILKVKTDILPIPKTYILQSGIGMNCTAKKI